MSALSEVISTGMYDNSTSEDALRADELHEVVGDAAFGVALAIGLEVA